MPPALALVEPWPWLVGTETNAIAITVDLKRTGERDVDVMKYPDVIEEERDNSTPDVIAEHVYNLMEGLAREKVVVPNISEVLDYLLKYRELTYFVLFAANRARSRFKSAVQLSLEVYHDPEIDDQYLALYVRQEEYDDNIFDVIDEISEEYEDNLPKESGWFILTTDLHPPI